MKRVIAGAACAAAVSLPSVGRAGGIFVPGAGPHAQARAGAFVARSDDPSAIVHNPAGFAKLDGTQIAIGANLVDYDLSFQRAGSYEASGEPTPEPYEGIAYPEAREQSRPSIGIGEFQIIPLIAISSDLGRPDWPVRFGFGLFTPQGYPNRQFADSHDVGASEPAPGPQRYDIIEQELKTIVPSLIVGYTPPALPGLHVGVRLSWGISSARGKKAVWSIRNYEEYKERDSVFTIAQSGDPFVPSYGVGVLYRALPSLELGGAWSSAMHIRSSGEGSSVVGNAVFEDAQTLPVPDEFALCEPGGREGALKVCVKADTPQSATIGGRWMWFDGNGRERADIELDVAWEDWSNAANVQTQVDAMDSTGAFLNPGVTRHGFRDTYGVRLGGAYAFPVAAHRLIARGGAAYDTAAAPDSFTRVDFDGKARATLTAGLGFEISRFRIDVGGGVSLEPDITVETCRLPEGPTIAEPGCNGDGSDTPVDDRTAPDPLQPKQGAFNQIESPFNAGTYQSGYVLLSVGVTTWF